MKFQCLWMLFGIALAHASPPECVPDAQVQLPEGFRLEGSQNCLRWDDAKELYFLHAKKPSSGTSNVQRNGDRARINGVEIHTMKDETFYYRPDPQQKSIEREKVYLLFPKDVNAFLRQAWLTPSLNAPLTISKHPSVVAFPSTDAIFAVQRPNASISMLRFHQGNQIVPIRGQPLTVTIDFINGSALLALNAGDKSYLAHVSQTLGEGNPPSPPWHWRMEYADLVLSIENGRHALKTQYNLTDSDSATRTWTKHRLHKHSLTQPLEFLRLKAPPSQILSSLKPECLYPFTQTYPITTTLIGRSVRGALANVDPWTYVTKDQPSQAIGGKKINPARAPQRNFLTLYPVNESNAFQERSLRWSFSDERFPIQIWALDRPKLNEQLMTLHEALETIASYQSEWSVAFPGIEFGHSPKSSEHFRDLVKRYDQLEIFLSRFKNEFTDQLKWIDEIYLATHEDKCGFVSSADAWTSTMGHGRIRLFGNRPRYSTLRHEVSHLIYHSFSDDLVKQWVEANKAPDGSDRDRSKAWRFYSIDCRVFHSWTSENDLTDAPLPKLGYPSAYGASNPSEDFAEFYENLTIEDPDNLWQSYLEAELSKNNSTSTIYRKKLLFFLNRGREDPTFMPKRFIVRIQRLLSNGL